MKKGCPLLMQRIRIAALRKPSGFCTLPEFCSHSRSLSRRYASLEKKRRCAITVEGSAAMLPCFWLENQKKEEGKKTTLVGSLFLDGFEFRSGQD